MYKKLSLSIFMELCSGASPQPSITKVGSILDVKTPLVGRNSDVEPIISPVGSVDI